ncbi:MAG: type II toxin-antitoxin system VapC family toxin [Terracidiphilus sp.]|jgi:predicted nucleic acid-binding protein
MPFVLDASVAGPWVLADEPSEAATRIAHLLLTENALVPILWWYEVRNLLVVCERRGRLNRSDSDLFLSRLTNYPIEVDAEVNWDDVMRLARKHRLTVYDASYLELAIRSRAPVATLDGALQRAAANEGVALDA